MAEKQEGQEAPPLERHLFAAGGDKNTAEKKLLGLLSDADLEAGILSEAGPEEGDPPAKGKAPVPGEGETGEEGGAGDDDPVVDDDDPPLGEEEPGKDDGEADDDEYEYVDADGNVIEDPGTEPETHTVMVDGKEHEVSLEDLISSHSFRAHNTRKSQELAEAQRVVDAEAATGRESREIYAQRLKQVEQALATIYPREPDWDALERDDPTRFATESAKWARHEKKMTALRTEQQRVDDEQAADELKLFNAFKVGESKLLMEAIPEWAKDDEVQAAEQKRLYAYAIGTVGFSEEEVDSIVDHRAVVALRKAMLFDELLARGRKVRKGKKGQKTTPLKPGIRRRRVRKAGAKRVQAARQRLSETGSVRDAEALLYDMLDDDV